MPLHIENTSAGGLRLLVESGKQSGEWGEQIRKGGPDPKSGRHFLAEGVAKPVTH